jgi:predicted transcriptional regulator
MKEITRAQEEIMQVLWKIQEGVVSDILEQLPNPKPAYNTVSTVVRVLEKKGYAGHKTYGKIHVYFPLIKQEEYAKYQFRGLLKNHFGNSMKRLVSFFAREEKMKLNELEDIKKLIEEEINRQKK